MAGSHGVGNDPTYNATTCFETYPFPWPPGQEPTDSPLVKAIADAARELVRLRDEWLNPPDVSEAELKKRTLTNLYNQRPTWLAQAHERLDAAVFAAYGWSATLTDAAMAEDTGDGIAIIEYSFVEPPTTLYGPTSPSIHFRHRGKANIAWVDGHVTARAMDWTYPANIYGANNQACHLGFCGPKDNSWFTRE